MIVVTTTGHIQTMVNPPGKPRARYFAGPRAGDEREAPAELGSARHRPLDPAPGRYVPE